jgi:glycosyltransferase involved in cell wall biosynthesis
MKTIAIDASRANVEQKTGVEWYAFHVIQELKRIVPLEYRVVLYSREPLRGPLAELPPLWKSQVLSWPPKVMWSQFRLAWELLWHKPDVFFEPAHIVPFLFPQGRTVNTLHDVAYARFPKAYTPWGWFYFILTTTYAKLRRVRFIAVSEFSKREMVELFRVRPELIDVVPLAPSLGNTSESVSESSSQEIVQKKYGIEKPYFLFVGRREAKKNIGRIVAAFGEFCVKNSDANGAAPAQLVLVGKKGEGYERELAPYRNEKWFTNILEHGYAPEADVIALYRGAHAFVFPSLYEGFGIPVLEAMKAECPVITSSTTSLPEVAGNAALLVEPTNVAAITKAMNRIWKEDGLREQLIANGEARVKEYSWKATAQKTWEVLERIAKGK